jgi:hypothetical protein
MIFFAQHIQNPSTGETLYSPNVDVRLENLVGGTQIEIDEGLVPGIMEA